MNKIANELIEKVKEFGDIIAGLTEQVKEFQKQLDDFKAADNKKSLRAEKGEDYYFIDNDLFTAFTAEETKEANWNIDNNRFEANNYFLSKTRAQEVADKLNFLLRLERLHDELCPDYQPSKTNAGKKYYVIYSSDLKIYLLDDRMFYYSDTQVYFPTQEIAQQACDILNAELEQAE